MHAVTAPTTTCPGSLLRLQTTSAALLTSRAVSGARRGGAPTWLRTGDALLVLACVDQGHPATPGQLVLSQDGQLGWAWAEVRPGQPNRFRHVTAVKRPPWA